jgi:hypothetical protein
MAVFIVVTCEVNGLDALAAVSLKGNWVVVIGWIDDVLPRYSDPMRRALIAHDSTTFATVVTPETPCKLPSTYGALGNL